MIRRSPGVICSNAFFNEAFSFPHLQTEPHTCHKHQRCGNPHQWYIKNIKAADNGREDPSGMNLLCEVPQGKVIRFLETLQFVMLVSITNLLDRDDYSAFEAAAL